MIKRFTIYRPARRRLDTVYVVPHLLPYTGKRPTRQDVLAVYPPRKLNLR